MTTYNFIFCQSGTEAVYFIYLLKMEILVFIRQLIYWFMT